MGIRSRWTLGRFVGWTVGFGLLSLPLEPGGTIDFLGFSDLAQVGTIENRSLYAISPILCHAPGSRPIERRA